MRRVLTFVILAAAFAVPLDAIMTYSPFPTSPTPTPSRGYVTEPGRVGSFSSPNYPGQYPAEYNYLYQIGTEFGKTAHLHFSHFDLADCYQCACASVTVESVVYGAGPPQTFCGSTLPGSNGHIYVPGPAYVRFKSARWSAGTGFFATYSIEYNASSPVTDNAPMSEFVYPTTPQPVYSTKPQPVFSTKPQPVYSTKPQPVYSTKPQPVYSTKPQPVYSTKPQPVYSTTPKSGASNLLLRLLRVQSEVRQMKDMASGIESELTNMIQGLDVTDAAIASDEAGTEDAVEEGNFELDENSQDFDNREPDDEVNDNREQVNDEVNDNREQVNDKVNDNREPVDDEVNDNMELVNDEVDGSREPVNEEVNDNREPVNEAEAAFRRFLQSLPRDGQEYTGSDFENNESNIY